MWDIVVEQPEAAIFDTLGNLGDFIGGVAVVVTLVYVALQIRQNTSQLRVSTAANQYDGILHAFDPLFHGANADVLQRGMADRASLTEEDSFLWSMLMIRIFGQFEMSLYQRNLGALAPAIFEMHSRLLEVLVRTPGGRSWWQEVGRSTFGDEFRKHVDTLLGRDASEFAARVEEMQAQ